MIIIKPPTADGTSSTCSISHGTDHYAVVNGYPSTNILSYAYEENATGIDLFSMADLDTALNFLASSLSISAYVWKSGAATCTAEAALLTGGTNYYGDAETLSASETLISYSWAINPKTGLPWTVADFNALEFGFRLISGGAGSFAYCAECYATLDITPVYNTIILPGTQKPKAFIDTDNLLKIETDVSPWGFPTRQIRYRDPDGNESNLSAEIADDTYLVALLKNTTVSEGKWLFKTRLSNATTSQIEEGRPYHINFRPQWFPVT